MTTHEYPHSDDEFPHRPPAYPPPYPAPPYPPPAYPAPPYPAPPGWPTAVDAYGRPLSDKSKVTAGLLGIFFGSIGLGRFYLGYTGMGVAQIAVTWLTCGLGGLWPLIDAIIILNGKVPDAQGRILRD
jgi:TM2 domain-containing membrane protein YozV